jgi:hypothetical protein
MRRSRFDVSVKDLNLIMRHLDILYFVSPFTRYILCEYLKNTCTVASSVSLGEHADTPRSIVS